MRNWVYLLVGAGIVGLAVAGAAAQAEKAPPAKPAGPDEELAAILADKLADKEGALKAEMAKAETGDNRKFTVVTDDDISALQESDIYKSNNSFFKVVRIRSKGVDGGKFIVERMVGKSPPSRKWSRVSGLGPLTIASRETLLDRFLSGGVLMYPIAFLLLMMIIIALNSLWVYRARKQYPRRFVESGRQALADGNVDEFDHLAMRQKGLLASICRAMVTNFATSTADDIQSRCESEALRQITLLRAPLKALNFIAAVAPLLGLLGTVIGMITCFDSIAEEAASAAKSQAMAGGIKVALLTTAAGLSVAVPSLLVYFIFTQKLNLIIAQCETLAGEFVHELITIKRKAVALARARTQSAPAMAMPRSRPAEPAQARHHSMEDA